MSNGLLDGWLDVDPFFVGAKQVMQRLQIERQTFLIQSLVKVVSSCRGSIRDLCRVLRTRMLRAEVQIAFVEKRWRSDVGRRWLLHLPLGQRTGVQTRVLTLFLETIQRFSRGG